MPSSELLSPVDLPPADESHPLRWTSIVIATAAALLGLFNATALVGWAHDLPPGPRSQRIVEAVEGWYDFTDRAGLTLPGKAVRETYDAIKAARFGDEKPSEN